MVKYRRTTPKRTASSPGWLLTYADMVTLLLTLFVFLFSFSTIDAAKWKELVISFTGSNGIVSPSGNDPFFSLGFGYPSGGDNDTPADSAAEDHDKPMSPAQAENEREFNEIYERINSYVEENKLQSAVEISQAQDQVTIRFKDSILFDSGTAALKPDALAMLDKIVPLISASSSSIALIRIEGHTDNLPIRSSVYPSNWELSTGRACAVLRYMLGNSGIDERIVSAGGYGDTRPVAGNDNEEGRAGNRRVDIVVIKADAD